MADIFQSIMFILSPIVLILDAIIITSGILRKFARLEKDDESERTKLFIMVDWMEKIGIVLGVITLLLAGYLAVKSPYADEWFNPLTIVFLCIIGALLTLRKLEDTPITALIALLAGFLGAAVFAAAFGTEQSKWIYFAVFLVIDVIVFVLVRTITKQMAMIGQILNWFPIATIISFACLGWGVFQIVLLAIYGINLIM
jgi:peptidoglycan/LPS O-acetylase OafA/YrhL